MKATILFSMISFAAVLTGCTSVDVDQIRMEETSIDPNNDAVVILGRRHSPEYETESSLINCIGNKIGSSIRGLNVLDEEEFQDALYPWFEPRTSPLNMENFIRMLDQPMVAEQLESRNVKYIIWIEGSTEKINSIGSMSCAIVAGGGGCFGFGSWEDQSKYEASIWDFSETKEVGRITTDAQGTSYMPAVVIPVPLLARVQSNACEGMGRQLSSFLQPGEAG